MGKKIGLIFVVIFCLNSSVYGNEFFIAMNGDFKTTKLDLPKGAVLKDTLEKLELYVVDAEFKPSIENAKFIVYKKILEPGSRHTTEDLAVDLLNRKNELSPWNLDYIEAPLVWNKGFRGQGVKVLVLDTGIDRHHPIFKNHKIISKDFTDTKVHLGVPYSEYDSAGHGTHTAGTILGEGVGVAPEAQLYAAKVCVFDCTNYRGAMVEALEWGIGKGIRVVNMSISFSHFSQELGEHIFEKLEGLNVVVATSSGNHREEESNTISFPGTLSTVLTVGAVGEEGLVVHFSNTGRYVDVVAPGVDILSADLVRKKDKNPSLLTLKSGTSMASPHVAGLAALLLSADPSLTANEVRGIIKKSASSFYGADEEAYGRGVINAHNAFKVLRQIRPVLQ